jgi:SAM-dependent methyltransferase
MKNSQCVVCGNDLDHGEASWHFVCPVCHYETSDLIPAINKTEIRGIIDEELRESGLYSLRSNNFNTLIDIIKKHGTATAPVLLDVGAAYGWFLDSAKADFQAYGIEPDEAVFARAAAKGKPIRLGYFPDALKKGEKFDVIVFNDVIEHIPDIESILKECHARLNIGGLLVLNLPGSQGIFYRVAKMLNRMGGRSFFERLWQVGMPSPHVHYFEANNLKRLLERFDFIETCRGTLPSLQFQGLYARISYVGDTARIGKIFLYFCIVASLPFLSLLPKDIMYGIYRRA